MRALLFILALVSASPASAGKTVLVGDSHMAGALGDALVPLLGGPKVARRYGIVSASAEMTYTTGAPVRTPPICPTGCKAVCPEHAASCPYDKGYRGPQDRREILARVPKNFPRMVGILEEEKKNLGRVILELGTNDAVVYGCSDGAVTKMATLLNQVKAAHPRSCVYIGPPAYFPHTPVYNACGANYNTFVDKLLAMARAKGCQAIDSRQAKDQNGPIRCVLGGFHCTPVQAAIWARLVASQLR